MARGRNNSSAATFMIAEDNSDSNDNDGAETFPQSQFAFSQLPGDQSQFLDVPRESEQKKLQALNPTAANRVITDLSRILLFKALSGEPIDKTKCTGEALGEALKKERIHNAVLNEAEARLRDVFGFGVRRINQKMEEDLPVRFKNRLYLVNDVGDDDNATHSVNIHSKHLDSRMEKGVLMMVLAFAFCKGTSQVRTGVMKGAGKKTRWIAEHHLYALLHRVDENIPGEPPSVEGKKKSRASLGGGSGRKSLSSQSGPEGGVGQTPDIDTLLERFVHLEYLLRDKIEEPESRESSYAGEDGKVTAYAIGPRANLEVGRRQIIFFCSQVLDEQPDPTMLAEVDEDEEMEEEESEEEEEVAEEETKGRKRSRK